MKTYDCYPSYSGKIFVDWDCFKVGRNSEVIWTDSVACCLAITLYSPEKKIGALAHIAGWSWSPEKVKPRRIIRTMLAGLEEVEKLDHRNIEATLAGEGFDAGYAHRNSDIVRRALNYYKIPIIGEDLCEAPGRFVFLDCSSGEVEVYRAGRW
jgi:chemotaxis receptor (MCP) glutamine deamidase CheD